MGPFRDHRILSVRTGNSRKKIRNSKKGRCAAGNKDGLVLFLKKRGTIRGRRGTSLGEKGANEINVERWTFSTDDRERGGTSSEKGGGGGCQRGER